MSRLGRWSRRVLFAVVLLLVLGAGAYVWIGAVAGPRLESEWGALEERKEPTRLSELAPPPVPEAENAAVVLRRAAALLLARTLLESRAGETAKALESVHTHLRLARLLEGEPTLIFTLVQASIEQVALRGLPRVLADVDLPEASVRALLAEIGRRDPRARMRLAMRGERCFGLAMFALLREDPARFGALIALGVEDDGGWSWRFLPGPILDLDEAYDLGVLRQVVDLAGKPYHDSGADRDVLDREMENPPWCALLSRRATPVIGSMLLRSEEHVACLDLARLALALEVHGNRHDGLPESLDDLDDDLIPNAPVDPFTGESYVYERVGETGFTIRSVGPDGEDDRGAADDVAWGAAD